MLRRFWQGRNKQKKGQQNRRRVLGVDSFRGQVTMGRTSVRMQGPLSGPLVFLPGWQLRWKLSFSFAGVMQEWGLVICPLTQGFGEEGMYCRNDSPVCPSLEVRVKWAGEGTGSLKRGWKEGPAQRSCKSHSSLCILCTSEERNILMLSFQVITLSCFNQLSDPKFVEKTWIGKKLTSVLTLALFLFANCKTCPIWIMSIWNWSERWEVKRIIDTDSNFMAH